MLRMPCLSRRWRRERTERWRRLGARGGVPPRRRGAVAGRVGAKLSGHAADAVLVEGVAQRAHGEVEDFGRARLVAARAAQCFEEVCLLKVFEMRDEVQALLGQT